jgi:Alkylmercury lyase
VSINGPDEEIPLDIPIQRAQLSLPGRELHRRILRAFVDNGRPPGREELHTIAESAGIDATAALGELAELDLVHLDDGGTVRVAYPFSGRATGIRVTLDGGVAVDSMCAVDALGIPPMTGLDAVITASDPDTGEPVEVVSTGGRWSWRPEGLTVVLASMSDTGDGGAPAATSACPTITFHATEAGARARLDGREDLTGWVLSMERALDLAEKLFGDLLDGDDLPDRDRLYGELGQG